MSGNSSGSGKSNTIQIVLAVISTAGIIVVAYLGYLQAVTPTLIQISATQTSEARTAEAEKPHTVTPPTTEVDFTPSTEAAASAIASTSDTPDSSNRKVSPTDGMILHLVPASTFKMGSNATNSETPVQEIYQDAFWIDETEVTNEMYSVCVLTGLCPPPRDTLYFNNQAYKSHPVVSVRWNDAMAYCEWAGRRLPTEAEWEKAARGTDGNAFPWGNTAPNKNLLNYGSNGTTQVAKYPKGASPYGALDMAGNVWEWVSTIYRAYPYRPDDGRENLSGNDDRVLRGSSWFNDETNLRSSYRGRSQPDDASNRVGFRCALSD